VDFIFKPGQGEIFIQVVPLLKQRSSTKTATSDHGHPSS
jgi:hypothetical protein